MKATIYDAAGNVYQLPVLLSWDISHGFCKPSDCFEVKFLYQAEMKEALLAACRFEARFKDRIVFYGVVDEAEFCADSSGCIAVLRGRGMQALLLDSQAESADYMKADIQFILNRHVIAQGIDRYEIGGKSTGKTASLSVSSGESHWSVLSRYAEFCLSLRPRFHPDGTLLLDGADSGTLLRISAETPIMVQRFVQDRYGVLSGVTVKNRVLGSTIRVENEAFQSIGGQCVRVINVPRRTSFDAMRHTGEYQIRQSCADMQRCRITLPDCFAAFPGDCVLMEDSPLGLRGNFSVEESRCFADGKNAGTVLELRPVEKIF